MFYNYCRIRQTLRVTPGTETGLSDHVWSLEGIAALSDQPISGQKEFSEAN
jgi:hypothetical protein